MTRLCEVRDIKRPPSEVFAVIADFSTTADYDPGVSRAERLDPVGPGARYEVDAVFMGRTLPMTYTTETYSPDHHLVFRGSASGSRARDDITLTPIPGGTRVTWILDLELTGAGRFAEPFLGPFLRRLGRKALDGLAHHLDSHADEDSTHARRG